MALHGIIGRDALSGSGSPFAGTQAPDPNPFPKGTKLKLFCCAVNDDSSRSVAEELLTKSLHNGGNLKKKGDVVVLDREGSFDRQGEYHVYLYYAELAEPEVTDGEDKKDNSES